MLLPASLLLLFVLLLPFAQLRVVNICATLGAIVMGSVLYLVLKVRWWGSRAAAHPAEPTQVAIGCGGRRAVRW